MSRPTSGRPVAARRTMKRGDDDINDLKAAYLVVAKSLTDDLETGKQLHQGEFYFISIVFASEHANYMLVIM